MQRLVLTATNHQLIQEAAIRVLRAGGLIIFPTETTYGAGVAAENPEAVAKVLRYKTRREGKPLSIAVAHQAMAERYVTLTDSAKKIYQRFLPGPVTVVSQGKGIVAPGVESEFGTLGIRIPDYPFLLTLLETFDAPITATSANVAGGRLPYTIDDVLSGLSPAQTALIDLAIDAGELPHNPPSTVIDTTLSTPVVFRQGQQAVIPFSQTTQFSSQSEEETKALAGRLMLKYWYQITTTGLIIGLDGSLGAGKTMFTKGIAEFLHIHDVVTSPTYTYMAEYPFLRHNVSGKLIHLDLWRLESAEEFDRLAIPPLLGPRQVVVMEWASQRPESVSALVTNTSSPYLNITLTQPADESPHKRIVDVREP